MCLYHRTHNPCKVTLGLEIRRVNSWFNVPHNFRMLMFCSSGDNACSIYKLGAQGIIILDLRI